MSVYASFRPFSCFEHPELFFTAGFFSYDFLLLDSKSCVDQGIRGGDTF